MKLILVFYTKNGKAEMTYFPDYLGPIPRSKEYVYADEQHKGNVFAVQFNFIQKEIVVKIR